jgi:hypothetical protein
MALIQALIPVALGQRGRSAASPGEPLGSADRRRAPAWLPIGTGMKYGSVTLTPCYRATMFANIGIPGDESPHTPGGPAAGPLQSLKRQML